MEAKVFCRKNGSDSLEFYVSAQKETHYLFSQDYNPMVWDYFSKPISIDRALNAHAAYRSKEVLHTMDKLPCYIRYIEREYDVEVFRKTAQKNARRRRRVA